MDHPAAETAIPIPTITAATRNTTVRLSVRARVAERKNAPLLVKLCDLLCVIAALLVLLLALFRLCGFIMQLSVQTEIFVEPESSITFFNTTNIASHVVISVKNHNKHLSVKYTDLHVSVAYRGHYLCTTSTQSFSDQGRRNGTKVSTTAVLSCTTGEYDSWRVQDDDLKTEFARGEVDVEVMFQASVEFGPWWFFQQDSSVCSYVEFTDEYSSNGGGQSMIMYATVATASESC